MSWRDRWLWEEIADRKIAQAKKNKRGRTCGFCGESGHNARTCPAKKQHRKDVDAMRGLAHRVVAACLSKAGLVPGALVRLREWNWELDDYEQKMCMVMGIDWDHVAARLAMTTSKVCHATLTSGSRVPDHQGSQA